MDSVANSHGQGWDSPNVFMTCAVRAVPTSVREAREFAVDAARLRGLPADVIDDVRLCVSEAVANAVMHAYGDDGGIVLVTIEPESQELVVVVRDFGSGVMSSGRSTAEEGGFGLSVISKLADSFEIAAVPEEGSKVTMTFGAPA
jgi:anti-sigma regulatory factor (Ser/Thr protein kinase)